MGEKVTASGSEPHSRARLGLPTTIDACLFDMDGVLTKTAAVHAAAWKEMFDAFLEERASADGGRLQPFDKLSDYDRYVDGKPRADGVRSFLESRRIELPEGRDDDPSECETAHGLGNRKDQLFLELIRRDGVAAYEGSVRYLHAVRKAGLRIAVVTSSKNCSEVLRAAKLDGLFDGQVDGNLTEAERLKGKPEPDTFLRAARMLSAKPKQAAVYEDALAGVEAGRAGGFGLVVGVDRFGQRQALLEHGANVVVKDLSDLMDART